jgi:chromosome segregation ATPase
MRGKILIALVILLTTLCFITPSASYGQERKNNETPKADDSKVFRELLDEVRQLRMALQRAKTANHRLQVTLERIRLQQARVDSLTRSLENVRTRLADLKNARPQMEEQIKYVEELIESGKEQNRRAEVEQQVKEMKSRMSSWSREEERLRERDAALSTELRVEQTILSDLQGQLDNMVRELERL